MMAQNIDTSGFPVGYFVIKSATGRVFDVYLDEIEDGTDIILSPEKEKSIVESESNAFSNQMVLKKFM
jgi:WD repeat-containing protein 23